MPPTGSGAKITYGTVLKRGDAASPEAFTTIAEGVELADFGAVREKVKTTNYDTSDPVHDYILGLGEGAEPAFRANFLPLNATQNLAAGLIADHVAGTRRNFKFVLSNSFGTFSFTALVTEWKVMGTTTEGLLQATFKLKLVSLVGYA